MQAAQSAEQRETQYFANLEGNELVEACKRRFDSHLSRLEKSGRKRRMLRSWNTYYAFDPNLGGRQGDTTSITMGGRQGETTLIKTNRYRGIMQRLLNMNAGSSPTWDCVAINDDSDSSRQAKLGDNVIEHYGSAFKLYERLLERDEHSLVLSEAYMAALWDNNRGGVHTHKDRPVNDNDGNPVMEDVEQEQPRLDGMGQPVIDEMGQPVTQTITVQQPKTEKVPVYKGDFRFLVLTPFDCATECYSEDRDRPQWCILRYYVNKWDLAALYPEQADKIITLQSCSKDREKLGLALAPVDDDDAIAVYEMYQMRSPAVPNGRWCRYLDGVEEPLIAGPMPYKTLPVFRTAPGDVILGDGAHTPGFDALQVSEARCAVLSTAMTNQNAAGGQVMRVSKGSGIAHRVLGNVTLFEMDDNAKFEPIVFDSRLGECVSLLEVLEQEEDFVTGLNAAARGDSEAMKGDSGSKGALVLSAAQQMQSRFQRSRQLADSMLFTHIIDTLKTHASVDRMIEISGKANSYDAVSFIGSDLKDISRVYVHPADPMKDTSEGRAKMLQLYMDLGLIKSPEDIYMVQTTGRLDHIENAYTAQRMLIDQENELLSDPENKEDVPVLPTDPHDMHIAGLQSIYTNMTLRRDPTLLKRALAHEAQHRKFKSEMMLADAPVVDPKPPVNGKAGAGGDAPGGPSSQPNMPKPPTNPSTGKPADIAAPPELQTQLAS